MGIFLRDLKRIKHVYLYSTRGRQHNIFTENTTGTSRIISVQEVRLGLNYVMNLDR